jgi:hypothetical protein
LDWTQIITIDKGPKLWRPNLDLSKPTLSKLLNKIALALVYDSGTFLVQSLCTPLDLKKGSDLHMYSSELYSKSFNSIYLFNQKTGQKSLSVLAIMTELPLLYMSVLLFSMVILTCVSCNSELFILILDNSLYLKNPENPNKNKTQILNLLTSLRSPKSVIIHCEISGVMGSFLQTGLLYNLLPPSRIRDTSLFEEGLFSK